jgi:hypothetical protein
MNKANWSLTENIYRWKNNSSEMAKGLRQGDIDSPLLNRLIAQEKGACIKG